MITLRVLGGADIRIDGAPAAPAVLAQPKRFALLAYLAVSGVGHFERRDALMALFWPESDAGRARAALRQSLRYLRRALGSGVIVNRGREEVGIAAAALTCDADAFARRVRAGASAEALALYGGPLLPGFFVAGAPAFERWLGSQRARLQALATDAAWTAVEAAEAEGRVAEARQWAGWAVERAPTEEPAVRRLMGLLERTGDRAGALRAYEDFVQRLWDELDAAPSEQTASLAEEIRSRGETPPQAGEASLPTRQAPTQDPRRVLVAVFENRTGDPGLDAIGTMLADWLAQGLGRVGGLRVVPLASTLASLQRAREGAPETATWRGVLGTVAEQVGAGTVVSGAYYRSGDDLRFLASVTAAPSGELLCTPEPTRSPVDDPIPAIEALNEHVVTSVAPLLDAPPGHVRVTQRPPTYAAYAAYMDGLNLFVRGEWERSLVHFERAAAHADEYALPRLVSAIAYWNLGRLAEADRVAEQAEARRAELGPLEDALLDNVRAWLRGDWHAAFQAAVRQAQLEPGSIPHVQVAQEARRLGRLEEAAGVLSEIDPQYGEVKGWIFYWVELADVLHMLGRYEEELEAAREAVAEHGPAAALLEVRALAALGATSDLDRALGLLLAAPPGSGPRPSAAMREAALVLRSCGDEDAARALFARNLAWLRDHPGDVEWQRELAVGCYHAGLWDEAYERFTALVREGAAPPSRFRLGYVELHDDRGWLGVSAARAGDAETAARMASALTGTAAPFDYGVSTYWRGAIAAVQGHEADAVALVRQAFAEGLPHGRFLYASPHVSPLRTRITSHGEA